MSFHERDIQLRSLFQYTADAVYLLDLSGNVMDVNVSFEKLYGWKRNELIGKPLPIIPEDQIPLHEDMINKAEWGARFSGVEVTRITKNGTFAHVSLTFSPIYNGEGDVTGISGIVRKLPKDRGPIEETLRYMTFYDSLTGLPNRKLFKNRFEQALTRAKRNGQMIAVMSMDVDKFRIVNDTYGDEIGDRALHQFVRSVQSCLRNVDTMARQGSDEFSILLPDIEDRNAVIQTVQQILHTLHDFRMTNEHPYKMSPSIGIAFYPSDGTTRHELLAHADEALREVKAKGGSGFKVYGEFRHD